MKRLLIPIFLMLAMNVGGQTVKKILKYRIIGTIHTDLNNDNKTDTIIISSSLDGHAYFNKITIELAGYKKQVFKARNHWTAVDDSFLESNKNEVNTDYLFLKKADKHAVILLFGEIDGAGYRGEFSIINIENNNVRMPFDQLNDNSGELDVEVPTTLIDLEHNGRLCFIFKDLGEIEKQTDKGNIGTYTPYFVYPVNDTCKLDKILMKKYNEDHYIFAGFKLNEKTRILYPQNGGKPTIWKK